MEPERLTCEFGIVMVRLTLGDKIVITPPLTRAIVVVKGMRMLAAGSTSTSPRVGLRALRSIVGGAGNPISVGYAVGVDVGVEVGADVGAGPKLVVMVGGSTVICAAVGAVTAVLTTPEASNALFAATKFETIVVALRLRAEAAAAAWAAWMVDMKSTVTPLLRAPTKVATVQPG